METESALVFQPARFQGGLLQWESTCTCVFAETQGMYQCSGYTALLFVFTYELAPEGLEANNHVCGQRLVGMLQVLHKL